MNIGNGTEQKKCIVCGKKTGDYIEKRTKKTPCCFGCIHIFNKTEHLKKLEKAERRDPLYTY